MLFFESASELSVSDWVSHLSWAALLWLSKGDHDVRTLLILHIFRSIISEHFAEAEMWLIHCYSVLSDLLLFSVKCDCCFFCCFFCTLRPPYCPLGRHREGERECPENNRLTDNRLYSLLSKPAIRCSHSDRVDQLYSNQRFGSPLWVIMDSRFPLCGSGRWHILSPGTGSVLLWGRPHWGRRHQRTLLWSWSASEAVIIALPWKRCVTNTVLTRVYSSVNYWLSYCIWARLQHCSAACLMNSLEAKYRCLSAIYPPKKRCCHHYVFVWRLLYR